MKGRGAAPSRDIELTTLNQVADEIDVESLARFLSQEAAADSELRSELESWQARVQLQIDGDVSNSVNGDVHGKVVQARDIGSLRIE